MAPDAVLCTNGHATYERIAKDERIPYFELNAGRRSKRTPHRSIPRFHAAVLRSGLQEPRSLRSMARRPRQSGAKPSGCAQPAARVRPSCQHDLMTPPPIDGTRLNGGYLNLLQLHCRNSIRQLSALNAGAAAAANKHGAAAANDRKVRTAVIGRLAQLQCLTESVR